MTLQRKVHLKHCALSVALFKENLHLTFHQVALWTLGQQVASTGYVVEPYRKYPSLLEVLLNFLKTEQNQGIRREVWTGASILAPNPSSPQFT